ALNYSSAPASPQRNWKAGSLAELIDHIINTHHRYTREELVRLQALLAKVGSVHGKNHPELLAMGESFDGLAQELTLHMMKEEMVLFPYVVRMEEAVLQKDPILPAPFGKVENPVRTMMQEHDSAGAVLKRLRELSDGYRTPPDACIS